MTTTSVLAIVVAAAGIVAVHVLRRLKRFDERSALAVFAMAFAAGWLGLGLLWRLSAAEMVAFGAQVVVVGVVWLFLLRRFRPSVFGVPIGYVRGAAGWSEAEVLRVLRAEDPARISGQADEVEVYAETARDVFEAAPPGCLEDEVQLVTSALARVLGNPELVSAAAARKAAVALQELRGTIAADVG
jgi:hypothetical protein